MLSILIPVYNRKITELVEKLANQCKSLNINYEIHCFDDMSRDTYRQHNRQLDGMFNVNYVEMSENLGRSKIRNRLAKIARYDLLLFLDCDTGIIKRDFIKRYIQYAKTTSVVSGGRNYQKTTPRIKSKTLHWRYGSTKESKSVNARNKYPYLYFHSNNFIVPRETMLTTLFDEQINGYGYEDLVFANMLKKKGIKIIHIDNETRHLDLISAKNFLSKTENSLDNLKMFYDQNLIESTDLIQCFTKLESFKLTSVFLTFIDLFMIKKIRKNLYSEEPNITYFQIYKLYYFCQINSKKYKV